ncbi:DUF2802 domain-containing protein [Pseudothauera rhizosphaerae]|uniref:DUF2802 domain-containing protein n=1 Tax=Pseudothauera rhizosphaerae TaxID=2565932 RepID=A0A4S4AL75_9RHOO|nr:DUF2802 domain-containing protein [Pseudothauera rhizosphaerae]THF60233.1 DUF2802 domain-containing protein [Pseudothauera rhizosphaerae]
MTLRTLLLLAIIALAIYAAWQLWRAFAARRRADGETRIPGEEADESDDEVDESAFAYAPLPAAEAKAESAPAPQSDLFQQELETQQLRRDIARLQAQHAVQQGEIAELRDGLRVLREQLEAGLAGQGVSPEYDEALVFARRGLEADAIAERCGISVAEAELVRSMTRRGGTEEQDEQP